MPVVQIVQIIVELPTQVIVHEIAEALIVGRTREHVEETTMVISQEPLHRRTAG